MMTLEPFDGTARPSPASAELLAERLRDWGLVVDAAAPPPVSKNRTILCRDPEGARVLVKAGDGSEDGPAREAHVLQTLGDLVGGPLRVPTLVASDPAFAMAAIAWIEGAETLHARHVARQDYEPRVAHRLGLALAALHGRGRTLAPGRRPTGTIASDAGYLDGLIYLRPAAYAGLSEAAIAFYVALQSSAEATLALVELARQAPAPTLLHGDVRPTNVLWAGASPVLIDWELAAWGDPARDFGAAAGHYARIWLAPESAEAPLPREQLVRFLRAFLGGYRQGRRGFPLERDFVLRCARWAGVATLLYVYSGAHFENRFDERARILLANGCAMLAAPHRWAWELFEALPC